MIQRSIFYENDEGMNRGNLSLLAVSDVVYRHGYLLLWLIIMQHLIALF